MRLSKFDARPVISTTLDSEQFKPFRFPDLWQLETHKTFSRLRIGPASRQIGLALDLCKTWECPVWVLVVVVASSDEWKEGRYQAPHPVAFDEAEMLLWEYQELFEQDGRLNLWIGSSETNDLLVIDRHNLIYAYGDLEAAQTTLTEKGLSEGEVAIPYPHTHHYHAEYDQTFRTLMARWDWVFSELNPEDDD